MNRLEKRLQAPCVIMNAIIDPEVYQIATKMSRVDARQEDGLDRLMLILDEHFKPNTFIRKVALWHEFRRLEKTPEMTWTSYLKKMKKTRTHLSNLGLTINDELYCIALINESNLDAAGKLNVESIARNADKDNELKVNNTEGHRGRRARRTCGSRGGR